MKRTLVLLSLFAVPLAADAATVMLPALPGYHEAGAWNKRPPRTFPKAAVTLTMTQAEAPIEAGAWNKRPPRRPFDGAAGAVGLSLAAGLVEAGAWNKRPPRNFCDCTGCEHCRPGCRCQ